MTQWEMVLNIVALAGTEAWNQQKLLFSVKHHGSLQDTTYTVGKQAMILNRNVQKRKNWKEHQINNNTDCNKI